MKYHEATALQELVAAAHIVVVVQADNPDADSLGSALALEQILSDLGKEPLLYCAVDMPGYLHYILGWDRVQKDLPKQFDASIIVDASTMTLFERIAGTPAEKQLASKPCAVLDHHQTVENLVPFANIMVNDHTRASAGELIYMLAKDLGWPMAKPALDCITYSILGDTQGLSNQLASAETYRIMAEMIEHGVDRPALEESRREYTKMPAVIFKYKAQLIAHTEFIREGSIASVTVPQVEINQYSPLYNPGPLVQNDMLQTTGVRIAIVFKSYDDGKVTAAIRCNPSAGLAAEIAIKFGGGGHAYASGFKVVTATPFDETKNACLAYASELLDTLDKDKPDETIQYAYQTN
ncbi:MAG: DHH family phosphoesterase [Patescibacteria group bacterium]|nr:DHH family phosphoesterase [Patescibacteria group bacterium]